MTGLLTETEIQALPEHLRQHYREHGNLRDNDDLVYFPAAKRESIERLLARGAARLIERIRQQEGEEAAAQAEAQAEAERAERERRVAELAHAS